MGDPPRLKDVGLAAFAMRSFARWVVTNSAAARDAEGVIDFQRRRYMIDFGFYAVLLSGGREWSGRSGRRLATLPARKPREAVPFVLTDLLAGVSSATVCGCEEIRGVRCRRVEAEAPADRASAVLSVSEAISRVRMPVTVWIADGFVRRAQVWAQDRQYAMELWDFGVDVTQWDWTRLPMFRTVS